MGTIAPIGGIAGWWIWLFLPQREAMKWCGFEISLDIWDVESVQMANKLHLYFLEKCDELNLRRILLLIGIIQGGCKEEIIYQLRWFVFPGTIVGFVISIFIYGTFILMVIHLPKTAPMKYGGVFSPKLGITILLTKMMGIRFFTDQFSHGRLPWQGWPTSTQVIQTSSKLLLYEEWSRMRNCNGVINGIILPSGKHTKNYGKSHWFMGKSTISMAIFNSYVKLPEGNIF